MSADPRVVTAAPPSAAPPIAVQPLAAPSDTAPSDTAPAGDAQDRLFVRFSKTPFLRRLCHTLMGPCLVVPWLWLGDLPGEREILLGGLTLALVVDLLRLRWKAFGDRVEAEFGALMKPIERRRFSSLALYCFSALVCVAFLPPVLGATAMLYLAFGDTAAGYVGRRFARLHIGLKSVEGSLTMAATCVVIGIGMLHFYGGLPNAPVLVAAGAAGATLGELAQEPWGDDNLTIPLGGAAGLLLASTFAG